MATTALAKTDRWSEQSLAEFRAKKRKRSDANIQKHVAIMEKLAAENGGFVPPYKWLETNGYFASYDIMTQYPGAFAHLPREGDKKFEIYKAHNDALQSGMPDISKPQILPPAKHRAIAEYDITGAKFSPTELQLDEGLSENEWMAVGRAISHFCQSSFFWAGDFLLYGDRHFGKKVTYDLAQQATGYSRTALYSCAYVAKRFPPERRVEALTFYHHSVLAKFLPDLADQLLVEAVEYGYTARQIRKLADEATGKKKDTTYHTVTLKLSDEMYQQLKERATGPLRWFVPQIIIDAWLKAKKGEA